MWIFPVRFVRCSSSPENITLHSSHETLEGLPYIMQNWICVTCGVQFGESVEPLLHCPICEDDRQYVGYNGQQWTTVEQLAKTHHNRTQVVEP
ncbi:MAG TPA: hypothetical protein VFD70_02950, partial [Anaerolineae bacterium]|nr:hypothetical protein [Anaerolineae bacterium]